MSRNDLGLAFTEAVWSIKSLQTYYRNCLVINQFFGVKYSHSSPSEVNLTNCTQGFPGGSDDKESACNEGDPGLIPESRRSLGEGNDFPLQNSCLKNSKDRGYWPARVHGVTMSQT